MSNGLRLLAITGGFVIWSVAFILLYAALSIGCHQGWDQVSVFGDWSLQRVQLVALYGLHLIVGVALVAALQRSPVAEGVATFMRQVAVYAAIAAVFSTAFTFAGTLVLTVC